MVHLASMSLERSQANAEKLSRSQKALSGERRLMNPCQISEGVQQMADVTLAQARHLAILPRAGGRELIYSCRSGKRTGHAANRLAAMSRIREIKRA